MFSLSFPALSEGESAESALVRQQTHGHKLLAHFDNAELLLVVGLPAIRTTTIVAHKPI